MNNEGRKRIDTIMKSIEETGMVRARIATLVEQLNEAISDFKETFADIMNDVEELRDEEQEKFDNMTDGLQQGERGQAIEATIEALDEALQLLEAVDEFEEIEFDCDTDDMITALDNAKYAG